MGASLVNSDTGDDGASGKKVSAKGVFLIYFLFTRGVRLADFLFAGPEAGETICIMWGEISTDEQDWLVIFKFERDERVMCAGIGYGIMY